LDLILAVACDEDPEPMRVHRGEGIGRLNGVPGATVEWALDDTGKSNRNDKIRLLVKNTEGDVLLDIDTLIRSGNLRGHEK
jgi:hypothetical protein